MQQSAYTEWPHEGSPNQIAVGADGLFPVKGDAYNATSAYAEAQVAFELIP